MTQIKRSFCKNIITLSVLIGLSACQQQDPPEVEKISAEDIAQIEEFIQSEISTNWNRIAAAGEAIPLQMFVRVGPSTDATVCTTGELYGPYTITNGSVEGEDSITADQPTLRLANLGDLSVCTIITSPVNANMDITADTLYLNANECKETPANIAGVWEGDYSCTSSCGGNQNGFVSLNIQQDEYSATYTDGSANYEGTVCGNIFEFSGEGPGYTEEGTFTLNSDGSASKTSSYQNTGDSCSGTCSDPVLIRDTSFVNFTLEVLAYAISGTASGNVTSSPIGIDCNTPDTCTHDFLNDTLVRLTAIPVAPSFFDSWAGVDTCDVTGVDGNGNDYCDITIFQDMNIIAIFDSI